MVAIPKVVGVLSCGFLLCLGLSGVASALTETIDDTVPGKTIRGEVLRVDGDTYIIKNGEDGKEVRLHVDKTTVKNFEKAVPGAKVEAKFNDQNHAIAIISDRNMSH